MQNVRSKVASKISKIKEADDFNFSNWLKKPAIHHYPVESLSSYLADTSEQHIEFLSPENSRYEFNMPDPDVTDELKNCEFPKVRSNAVFFMIALPSDKGFVFAEVDLKPVSYSARLVEFLPITPSIKSIKVKFDYKPPRGYDLQLKVPSNQNYLSNLVPEIFKVDLLDFEDLVSSTKKVKVQNIKIEDFKKTKVEKQPLPGLPEMKKVSKIKIPSIGSFKSTQREIPLSTFEQPTLSDPIAFKLSRIKTFYANFKFSRKDTLLLYRNAEARAKEKSETQSSIASGYSQMQDVFAYILSNVRRIDWEKSRHLHIKLMKFEETGAKFLAENEAALLQEEFGIDTEKEVIAALKLLFGNRVVKSALIVTDSTKIGNPSFAQNLNLEIGWSDKLKKFCPELDLNIISGSNDERADLWNKSKAIVIADIDTALNDFRLKILEDNRLKKFDCIILDSADNLLLRKDLAEEFLSSLKPKILWATSAVLDRNLQSQLNENLNHSAKIQKVLVRSKKDLAKETPKFIFNEFWLEADEYQAAEFKTALVDSKKEVRRVLETGNPLRFAANIFTLFHRLNQLGNFATGKSKSPKTELLLKHILKIKENNKKVLILSQYEKLGTKKIAELLAGNGIKHIHAPNALSVEEMKQSILNFKTQTDTVAFITDSKPSRLKFSGIDVSYVIRFDQWWNPLNNWELEDMFQKNGEEITEESINIFNYYSLGTLDQKVRELLLEADLLNKNVFELMQPKLFEELISVDEWLRIFGMPVSDENNSYRSPEMLLAYLKKMSVDDYRKVLSRFFAILGFSEIEVLELQETNSFNIVGKAQRNSRVFFLIARAITESKIDKATFENIVDETTSDRENKYFFITRDSFPAIDETKIKDNVTLIDGHLLAKYLTRVGIVPAQPK